MLTAEQQAILKADILGDQVLNAYPNTPDGAYAIAALYSVLADPGFIVWKTAVNPDEIMRNGMDWTRVDNLTVGKARIWEWMIRLGTFDASKTNIRAGIDAAWVGTSADLAVRAVVYTHCKRAATRAEKLFSSGTGTTEAPATMGREGALSYQEVYAARNS
ncbi:MAG: hypothetical protein PHU85_07225 [Phycisphaerae bacterium]|nr:hypothetical protein [Phycisphaerae bacterium]